MDLNWSVTWPALAEGLILLLVLAGLVIWRYYSLQNRRLFRQEREQRELAQALVEAAAAVNSSLDLEEVLDRILEQVERVVSGDAFNVMLIKKDGLVHTVRWREYAPLGTEFLVDHFIVHPTDVPNLREVMETGRLVIIGNVTGYSDWITLPGRERIRAYITAPIHTAERIVGFLNVAGLRPNQFTAEDGRRLEAFASQAAIAIENARLYEQARQDAETKAILLHEINHRVKNNLSAIIGLLYAELHHAGMEKQAVYQAIIEDLINRTQGLATVHRLLSDTTWTPLLLSELVSQIIKAVLQVRPSRKEVHVNVSPAEVRVTPRQANQLALVVNELATNTLKYGLVNCPAACINVEIVQKDDQILLQFQDNGPGYPEAVLHQKHHNVGLYLVHEIVCNDLRGRLVLSNEGGAVTRVYFPQALEKDW